MASLLRFEGEWPGPMTVSLGWFRARVRPWNEEIVAPMVRLDRGGAEFLISVTTRVEETTGQGCFSPALYGSATRVWRRAGYEHFVDLSIMERALGTAHHGEADHEVDRPERPDWDSILRIDRLAFDGFWGMSRDGLIEALATNRASALLTVASDGETSGFAIIGSQWGVGYLHRIAVDPARAGSGLGKALLDGATRWAGANGARSMVLNVRADNSRARRLYEKAGFTDSGTTLEVLSHRPRT